MDQLSLVFFTVLAQSAVGIFIALGLVELLGRPNSKTMNTSFIVVWAIHDSPWATIADAQCTDGG